MGRRISLFLVVLMTILYAGAPSFADEQAPRLDVVVTQMSPQYVTTTGEISIIGTVKNPGSSALNNVSVGLWRDATPLTTPAQLKTALDQSGGGAVSNASGASMNLGSVEPGETKNFKVSASLDPGNASEPLWLSQQDAAYRIGVEARSDGLLVGAARTAIVNPGSSATTAQLVVLNSKPALNPLTHTPGSEPATADLLDADALSADLSQRLEPLLRAADSSDVLVDPALIDQLTALGTPQATEFLTRLKARISKSGAYRGLYNSPDVATVRASGTDKWLDAANRVDAEGVVERLPLIVSAGEVSGQDVEALAAAKPVAVLARNLVTGPAVLDGVRLVAADSVPSNSFSAAGMRARQLIFGKENPLVTLVASPQAIVDSRSGWLETVSIDGLLSCQPESEINLSSTSQPSKMPDTEVLSRWVTFTGNSKNYQKILDSVANAYASSAFTGSQRDAWLAKVLEPARALDNPNAVQLLATDTVTTSEKDNALPVTIVNSTGSPALLRVRFDSDNDQRVWINDTSLVELDAGEQLTLRVNPHSKANGPVEVRAQLVLEDGQPIGEPVSFLVTATKVGNVAWVLIIASGAVLLTVTAWRVHQVRRKGSTHVED